MKRQFSPAFHKAVTIQGRRDYSSYVQDVIREDERQKEHWQDFDPQGNVYLIGNRDLGFYKIGFTRTKENPDARFKSVQHGVPFDLDVLRYWFVKHAQSFERLLHEHFRDSRIRGEWFQFPSDTLDGVIVTIKDLADKVAVHELSMS